LARQTSIPPTNVCRCPNCVILCNRNRDADDGRDHTKDCRPQGLIASWFSDDRNCRAVEGAARQSQKLTNNATVATGRIQIAKAPKVKGETQRKGSHLCRQRQLLRNFNCPRRGRGTDRDWDSILEALRRDSGDREVPLQVFLHWPAEYGAVLDGRPQSDGAHAHTAFRQRYPRLSNACPNGISNFAGCVRS
jgi:hypothetical protein